MPWLRRPTWHSAVSRGRLPEHAIKLRRQPDGRACTAPRLRVEIESPADALDDGPRQKESEAHSLAGGLGREERLARARQDLGSHAASRIFHFDAHRFSLDARAQD